MPLLTDLPTTKADGDANHTAGHNDTNTRVNEIATEVNAHEADTTSVHGIADTSALATTSGVTSAISTHAGATDPHGDRGYTDTVAATKQPLDSDLTTIAGLTATTDNFLQSKSSAWASRTPTQVAADLVTPLSSSLQPIDSDLTAIAALSPSNDDVVQRKAGAWTNRTMAQVKTDLALTKTDVGLSNVTNNAQVTGVTAGNANITIGGTATAPTVAVTGSTFQPLDSDLTTIAGLTATTDSFLQSKSSAWAARTVAQVKSDLGVTDLETIRNLTPGSASTMWGAGYMESIPRIGTAEIAGVSGRLRFTYFIAPTTVTITTLAIACGSTSHVTPTLTRMAIFTVDGSGNLTKVAQTANDTNLLNVAFDSATAGLSTAGGFPSSWTFTAGTAYAVGMLDVAATPASPRGANVDFAGYPPVINRHINSQTDISASYTSASLTSFFQPLLIVGLP